MKRVLIGIAFTSLFGTFITASPNSASARLKYFNRFRERYGEAIPDIATLQCAICHGGVNGADRKIRSAYAMALEEQIGMKNCTDDATIDAALQAMEAVESEPDNPDGPTYGELLAEGNLPAPAPPPEEEAAEE